MGFANFYCRFVKGYSKVVEPLTQLTRKGQPFKWETKQQESFDGLKTSFTRVPILHHFDHNRDIVVETDASDFVSITVLSQYDDEGTLHPVAFFSKKHSPAECSESPTGRLLYQGKFYVPAYGPLKLYLIQTHHKVQVAGHPR